ncbi:DNA-binding response regulator [Zoogloeaceae bacteirum Par-f-2]|jgi:two-component system response regulator AlgR|nr:hypothetical protein B4966_12475 [Rhodocyclaceae bacterium]AVZ80070.1 DNA-binding response regulator [Zoogloeaceae bacteirum Par-f-2]
MTTLDIVIADDEPLARSRLRRLLSGRADLQLIGEAACAAELRAMVIQRAPHLVILDIDMPGEDGLSAAHWLAEMPAPPAVIFVTAHPQFALDAFSAHAAGYLLKPVERDRLLAAIEAARKPTRASASALQSAIEPPRVSVSAGRRARLLPAEDIVAFRAEDKGVTVFARDGQYFVDESLKNLAQRFEPAGFLRVHRAWLVALGRIRALERDAVGRHWIEIAGLPETVPVSRRQLAELHARLRR